MNETTVIGKVLKYSRDCQTMRFVKLHVKQSMFLAKRIPLPFVIPSADSMNIVLEELEFRIQEREDDIKRLLTPLFEGKDFGYDEIGRYSLSQEDIKNGYIALMEVCRRDPTTNKIISYKPDDYVILLRQYKKRNGTFTYEPGILYKVGGELEEKNLLDIRRNNVETVPKGLIDIIIKKKTSYEYLE